MAHCFIQPPARLNFRATVDEVDNVASCIRDNEVALMNRDHRIERDEREREQNE